MTELTKEQYDQVPDFLKDGFEQDGDVFVSKESRKVASLKSSLDNLDAKSKSETQRLNERLAEIEAQEAAKIEEARIAALEEAKSKGDVDAIEQRYREQMADAIERAKIEATAEAERQYSFKEAKLKAKAEISEMVSALNPVNEKARKFLTVLLSQNQEVTEDCRTIYKNDDGSASSLDAKGYLNSIIESGEYGLLIKANPTTKGAGVISGQTGGGLAPKSPKTMNSQERIDFKNADPEGFRKAFNLN